MTLALYGKSRKRQGGLIFAAFMAIIVASVGALAMVTTTFAHHLEGTPYGPTCQNGQTWRVRIVEGQWSDFREAVLTITDPTTSVGGLRFSPYISDGSGSGVIVDSGIQNAPVHTAGNVKQYTGSFAAAGYTDTSSDNIDGSTTSLDHSGGTAWNANFIPGSVMKWGTELMLITARSDDGKTLTVERGHGDTSPNAQTSNTQGVWKRGGLEGSPNTISWDLDAEIVDCDATRIIVKKTVSGTNPPATNFAVAIDDLGNGAGADYNGSIAVGTDYTQNLTGIVGNDGAGDTDDFTVTEASGGSGWTTRWALIDLWETCDSDVNEGGPGDGFTSGNVAAGGDLSNIDPGETVIVCFKNTYTPPPVPPRIIIKKVTVGDPNPTGTQFTADIDNLSGGNEGSENNVPFKVGTPAVRDIDFDGGDDDDDFTVTEDALANWAVTGNKVLTGDATCPAADAPYGSGASSWATGSNADSSVQFNLDNDPGDAVTVCFRNEYTAPPTPSVSVTKDAPAATYNLGDSFAWTITATVTNGPTTADYPMWDPIPSQFTLNSVTINDPGELDCTAAPNLVSCTLESGAATGAYTFFVNVTVNADATCGPVTNNVRNGTDGSAPVVASDEVTIAGCGSVTIEKSDSEEVVGSDVIWTIVLKNSSAVSKSAIVYDPNTTLVAAGTVGCANNAQDDYYDCTVPAFGQATLKLSQAIPAHSVCDDYQLTNTAYIAASNTAGSTGNLGSDSGVYSDPANADTSCLTVTKDKTATSNPPTWTISVQNTADVGQSLWVVDAGATFQSASGGSCTATAGVTDMTAGIPCTVNANSTLVITVTKPMPAATCQGTDVDNAVSIWVGTFTGTPTGTPADFTDNTGNLFTDLGADLALCSSVIEICKVWAFNAPGELSDGSTSFVFDVSDTSETEGVTISGVTEGNQTATCILVEVQNGLVTIDEQVPGGFNTPTYTSDIPGVGNGTGAGVAFFVDGESCYAEFPTLLQDVSGLVREVLAVVAPVTGEPLCTITFTNTDNQDRLPTGDLRVEKYLDINGDGDANDPGEGLIPGWDVNISGPDENGIFDLTDGTNTWLGLTTNDVYILTEVQQAGFTVTNATVDGVSKGASLFAAAVIPNGGTTVVRFYNQPAGGIIIAHKVAVTSHNFGPDQDAPNDDDGWIITVTSAQCGINISLPTDANGNATFTNLPLCTDYVVSENPVNAASPGFNPVSPTSIGGQTPEGQTITFRNRKVTNDPPCVNCGPTPTPTVPTPTPTTPATPTSTPVPPTATPTEPSPVSTVVGERTPGPAASATPIAPSTGGGLMGGTSGGMNLVLIIAGLLALTSGLSFVALGRKHRS